MNAAHGVPVDIGEQAALLAEDEVDLAAYWRIVSRDKWGILGLSAVVGLLTMVIVYSLEPIYRATAQLLVEAEQVRVVSIEEVYGIDSSQREYYQTQFEIMNSKKLSDRVIREVKINEHWEYEHRRAKPFSLKRYIPFLPAEAEPSEEQRWRSTVRQFQNNLTITPIRNTQLVNISFESKDSELAPAVANALGTAYIENHLEARLALTQKAATWLTKRLSGMQHDLEVAERNLRSYQERENLIDVSGVQTLTANELDELTRRLVDARKATASARSQYEAVGDLSGDDVEKWETLTGVVEDQLAQKLKQEEELAATNFFGVQQRYGPKHPNYINADSQAKSAQLAYRQRVSLLVSGFEEKYQQAQANQRDLEGDLANSKSEIQEINRKSYQLSQLQREVDTSRQLYDLFFQRFKETNETDFAAANARFVDNATRSFDPVKPRKMVILAAALSVSFMVGVMLSLLRATLDNTIKLAEQIEEKLHQAILGVVPWEKKRVENTNISTLYFADEHKPFAESVRSLRTSVILSSLDNPHKVILVTSSLPGEGKTTISSNLALAFGQMEKVLLIDADMRRPSLAKEYNLDKHGAGLSELVAGISNEPECIKRLEELGIDLITSGAVPPNPLDLLSSKQFEELLHQLKERYDRIIIDSAPTQAVSDSLVLSAKADALIYVVKSDATPANVAKKAIERLMRVGAPVIGCVLNQFDPDTAQKYGYFGYGSGKHGYYGYGYASKNYS
ncbi:MAG: polysaccharide biosynthesis tyrosine autokinase [Gammaproteobacteria bacterium]|nr:polysaccharide biosynthesis tyrosine autokinase [Gammaproteobacteria bacterium]